MSPEAQVGLRERKKVRTRSAIQHEALRLFREKGYEATTVSQIAEAAEVSESTFFRYFGSKEAVVFEDDFDEVMLGAFRNQPTGLGPVQAMRAAVTTAFAGITAEEIEDSVERAELVMRVPVLRQAVAGELVKTMDKLALLCAERMALPPSHLRVRALAGSVVGAMLGVFFVPGGIEGDFVERIDAALAELESGFGQ